MKQSKMKFLKFAMHKRYFDTGMSVTNYLKYPLVLLGIAIPKPKWIIAVAGVYAIICYITGWWWLNYGMQEAETEISNIYNPFVKEMRKIIVTPNNRKI